MRLQRHTAMMIGAATMLWPHQAGALTSLSPPSIEDKVVTGWSAQAIDHGDARGSQPGALPVDSALAAPAPAGTGQTAQAIPLDLAEMSTSAKISDLAPSIGAAGAAPRNEGLVTWVQGHAGSLTQWSVIFGTVAFAGFGLRRLRSSERAT